MTTALFESPSALPQAPAPRQSAGHLRGRRRAPADRADGSASAFDVILPTPVPGKGEVLTALSLFWFRRLAQVIPNHLLDADPTSLVAPAERDQSRRPGDGRAQAQAAADRGDRAGLRGGIRVEGVPAHRRDLRHPAAGRVAGGRQVAERDLHALHQSSRRNARREHPFRGSRAPARRRAGGCRCARRPLRCTPRLRTTRARAASSSPTPSSSSAPMPKGRSI